MELLVGLAAHLARQVACFATTLNNIYSICFCMPEGLVSNTLDTVLTYIPIFVLIVLLYPQLNAELLATL